MSYFLNNSSLEDIFLALWTDLNQLFVIFLYKNRSLKKVKDCLQENFKQL